MTHIATTIYDNIEQKIVPAEWIVGVDAGTIEEVGLQWKNERIQKALRGNPTEHYHWDWSLKASSVKDLLAYEFFALKCRDVVEGLMLTESVLHREELPPDQGKPILYIEFIESAPKNTTLLSDVPHYRGIGTRLMEMAARYSVQQGFEGRIGLLALPQAEPFYLKKGLENYARMRRRDCIITNGQPKLPKTS